MNKGFFAYLLISAYNSLCHDFGKFGATNFFQYLSELSFPAAIRVNEQNEVTDKTRNDIITRYDIIKIKKSQAGIEIIYGFAWERKGENI